MPYQGALQQVNNRDRNLENLRVSRENLQRQLRDLNMELTRHQLNITIDFDRDFSDFWRRGGWLDSWQVEMIRAAEQTYNRVQRANINEGLLLQANELQLRGMLADIELAELDVIFLNALIDFEEQSLFRARLMHSVGMETDAGLRNAESNLAQSKSLLESAEITLQANRRALNTLLGLQPEANVRISGYNWNIPRSPEMWNHIQVQYHEAPTVALRELDYRDAFVMHYTYVFLLAWDERAPSEYRRIHNEDFVEIHLRNERNAVQRALTSEREVLERRIRELHGNLTQISLQRNTAAADLANARMDYQAVNILNDMGMATPFEMSGARLAILQHEIALAQLEINYGLLRMVYNWPYLG